MPKERIPQKEERNGRAEVYAHFEVFNWFAARRPRFFSFKVM